MGDLETYYNIVYEGNDGVPAFSELSEEERQDISNTLGFSMYRAAIAMRRLFAAIVGATQIDLNK